MSAMLPAPFADLEVFAQRWCLTTEPERYGARLGASMEELQTFTGLVTAAQRRLTGRPLPGPRPPSPGFP